MRVVPVLALLALLATAAFADEPVQPREPGSPPPAAPDIEVNRAELADPPVVEQVPEGAVSDKGAAPRPVTPLTAAIEAALAAEQTRVVELEARLAQAPDEAAAAAIVREIELAKQAGELEVMRIQADFARRAGREEQAREIEAAIAAILAPPPPAEPQERPAPATDRGRQ